MEEHARWRYLLSADGQGASWRLAKLLAINSLVLKHRSQSIEYYYRSLVDGKHYVSVDTSDLIATVGTLESQEQAQTQQHAVRPADAGGLPTNATAVVAAAQAFAYRYLSQVSRCAYAAAALRHYTSLYADLPLLLQELEGLKPSVESLLAIRTRWMSHDNTRKIRAGILFESIHTLKVFPGSNLQQSTVASLDSSTHPSSVLCSTYSTYCLGVRYGTESGRSRPYSTVGGT
eukprot:349961-Chlamydomonas_euryale.AAC.19